MSSCSFVQTLNPLSSKMEWKVVNDDYDYNQEIATSCYGDMLHDDERVSKIYVRNLFSGNKLIVFENRK